RLIKRDTRHFAKRQLTWFRKDKEIDWFDVDKMKFEDLITQTEELIRTNLQPEDKKLIEG
ncbi:MAG: tRNA dimethylallyltransferase, partial [Candidatus Frackibacter sp. T328-2]